MADIRTMNKPVVALGSDLMRSLLELPKKAQKHATTFLTKFQVNPRSSGINLERIANAADEKLYSARIDQRYRAIIAFQKSSNVYVLLYVGDHDDAYKWAETKKLDVNPNTRAIQLYDMVSQEEIDTAMREDSQSEVERESADAKFTQPDFAASEPVSHSAEDYVGMNRGATSAIADSVPRKVPELHTGPLPDTYLALTDNDMRRFGVPDMYVPVMCTRKTWEAFDRWGSRLPEDAFAYLTFVAEGLPKSEVFGLLDETEGQTSDRLGLEQQIPASSVESGEEADPEDFRAALSSYASQQSFVVVQGEADLKRILDAPLEQWRVFLHPSQRLYVEHDYHGPFRLLGGAGTGKTVVAMHRAKRLAARLLRSGSRQKVLFTTYSRNLATDIASNLKLICTADEFNTIDVVNLDKLVKDLLMGHGYSGEIWYDGSRDHGNDLDAAWRKAITSIGVNDSKLTVSFFKSELSQVIVPQQVRNAADYMRVLRKGRGTRLNRAQKLAVWQVVETYRRIMQANGAYDVDTAMQNVVSLLTQGDTPRKYAHVVVDEGQDFSTPAYRVIRALVDEGDNDIFIVGDAQQRIYGHTAVLSKCGIRIQGRARKLRINYRTTEQIRSAADSIFRSSGADVADSVFAAVRGIEDASPATTFDDLDGEESPTGDSRSLMSGPVPETQRFASQSDEMDAVREWIYGLCGTAENMAGDEFDGERVDPRNVCVVARSRYCIDQWYKTLDDGLPYGVYRLGRDAENRQRQGIRIATMHRVKGLEFDYVVVVDVNDGVCPPKPALQSAGADPATLNDIYREERSLIYVAMTRAKKGVLLTGVSAQVG
ncbi:UvrD-helicase domain-containing protein [Bifidobacterium pseudocatenulatum]|uniref:UvrD-helicase domain-containing protein n=1 Tax=Bifidobacterium pseudocatenulatum TaxID=28026 RepID=UPI0022E47ABE|nr:UvrD-helicase domain-containing protein [Bifidobacterium pseudocatenulatum]